MNARKILMKFHLHFPHRAPISPSLFLEILLKTKEFVMPRDVEFEGEK